MDTKSIGRARLRAYTKLSETQMNENPIRMAAIKKPPQYRVSRLIDMRHSRLFRKLCEFVELTDRLGIRVKFCF